METSGYLTAFLTSRKTLDRTVDTKAKTIAAIIAGIIPCISKPGTNKDETYKIMALITKVNKPKDNKFIGAVTKDKIGFMTVFIKPITKAAITAVMNPSILNPGTTLAVISSASTLNSSVISSFK